MFGEGGWKEKIASSFSWGKKEKKVGEEAPKYTLTGQPANEAARKAEAAKSSGAGSKASESSSARPADSRYGKGDPAKSPEPKFEPVSSAEAAAKKVNGNGGPAKPKQPQEIYMKQNERGEFDVDPNQSPRPIKHESDSFIVPDETVPRQYNPNKLIEAGENKQLVRHSKEVQRYQPEIPIQEDRPRIRGQIESGQTKEVMIPQRGDLPRVITKPEPVPEPIPEPVPKPPKQIEEHFEERLERVQLADINAIVESYAQRVAEKKLHERKEGSSFATKWIVRLAEDGYYKKYFDEAKAEIMKKHNLLSQIETHFLTKSEGKPLNADATDIHYEILDKVIEAFDKRLLEERSTEVKAEHIRNMDVDLETGRLFADFAMGKIADRTAFDRLVEERIVPLVPGAKDGERMYASNLYQLAENYRKEIQDKLQAVGKEMGAEQEAYVRKFFEKTLRLDLQLGEKNRDLAQRLPGESMKGYEKWVDMTQNGFFNGNSKVGRAIGRFVANPVTYAAVGGLATRGVLRAAGIGVASALTFGSATAVIVGSGIGAGIYMGWRASRERRRDIMRREQEATLGQRNKETHELSEARGLITQIEGLTKKKEPLTEEEKQQVAEIRAKLRLQTDQKVDLIRVGKEEGDKYGTKLNAETDLRAALDGFWQARQGEFNGANAAEQQRAYDRMVADAERRLLPEIEKVNKEVADEIKKRGIKVGLLGGAAAAAMTGVMGGYVTKGFESLHDWAADHGYLGAGASHWTGPNKVTWIQELGHKLGIGHHGADTYHGPLQDQASAFLRGHTNINMPPGYQVHDMMDHGNHFINITGPDGHVLPGADHIAVGPDGKILDPDAFNVLQQHGWRVDQVPGTPGTPGGGGAEGWLNNLKDHIHGGKVEHIRTHGFYDNDTPMHVDPGSGKLLGADYNELRFYIHSDGSNIKLDASKLLQGDSWHGSRVPQIDRLLANGGVKIAIAPDAAHQSNAILLDIDPVTKQVNLPLGEPWVKDMFDPATGHFKGGLIGTVEVTGTTPDGSKAVWWLNALRGSGNSDLGGAATPGAPDIFSLSPSIQETMEYPAPIAGWARETDKDAEENRKKRLKNLEPKKSGTSTTTENGNGTTEGGKGGRGTDTGPQMSLEDAIQDVFYGKKPANGTSADHRPQMSLEDAIQDVFYDKKPAGGTPARKGPEMSLEDAIQDVFYGKKPAEAAKKKPEIMPLDQAIQEVFYGKKTAEKKEKTPEERTVENLKAKLDANNLTEKDVDKAAADLKVDKVEILTRCLEAKNIDFENLEAGLLRGAQKLRVNYNRGEVLWNILEQAMADHKKNHASEQNQKPEEENSAEQGGGDTDTTGRTERTREKKELTAKEFVEKLNGQFEKIKFHLNRSAEDAIKRMPESRRKQALDNIIAGFKDLQKKLGKPARNNLAVEITTGGKIDVKADKGEIKGLYVPLNSKPKAIFGVISGFVEGLGRKAPEKTGRPGRPESKPGSKKETKPEAPDLAESLSGKFSRLDVQVTGDGQNEFTKLPLAVQRKNIESLKAALGRINEKLGERGIKGKIRIDMGKVYEHIKHLVEIPSTTTGTGAENYFNNHIDEIAPAEKTAAKKAPEKKKEERGRGGKEQGPKKKLSNRKIRPKTKRKPSTAPRR